MVLDHRHGKRINTITTPRIGSTLEVKISRMVGMVAINTVLTPRRGSTLEVKISRRGG